MSGTIRERATALIGPGPGRHVPTGHVVRRGWRRTRRMGTVGAAAAFVLMVAAGTALAAFGAPGAGTARAASASLTAPTGLSVGAPTCAGTTAQRTVGWTGSAAATGYLVEAARDSAFTDLVASQTTTTTSATVSYPATLTSYTVYLRVRSTRGTWTGSTAGTASTPSTCTSDVLPVPTAVSAPTNTCTGFWFFFTAIQPVSWKPVSGATEYDVDVATDSAFRSIVQTRTVTTPTTTLSVNLPLNGRMTVFVRVRATAGRSTGPYSPTTTVSLACPATTDPTPTPAPTATTTTTTTTTTAPPTTLTTPPPTATTPPPTATPTTPTTTPLALAAPTGLAAGRNTCTGQAGSYTATQPLSWNAVGGATGYVAEAALDSGFGQIVASQTVTSTAASFSAPLPAGGTVVVWARVTATAGSRSSAPGAALRVTVSCP